MNKTSRTRARSILEVLMLTAMILVAAAGLAVWRFGSIGNALAYLRGSSLVADRTIIDLGDIDPRTVVKGSFTLRNLSTGAIRITGSSSSCACAVVAALPADIGPGEKMAIEVSVAGGTKAESREHMVELYLNKPGPPLRLVLKGRTRNEGGSQTLAKNGTGE